MANNGSQRPCQPSREVALRVRGIKKAFRSQAGAETLALDGVDLSVDRGEFVVLIGPTGCGKSTLLNILGGVERPNEGEIVFETQQGQPGRVGYVFQHYTMFPWRTLIDNVAFSMQMQGVPRRQRLETARDLLDQVGLSGFASAYPHETSGGMRQRAAIAQALAVRPEILLMDEPFGALDDGTRTELQHLLVRLYQESEATVLFVTHNIDEAVALADRIVVCSSRPGRIVQEISVPLSRPRRTLDPEFTEVFVQVRKAVQTGLHPLE